MFKMSHHNTRYQDGAECAAWVVISAVGVGSIRGRDKVLTIAEKASLDPFVVLVAKGGQC